VATALLPLSQSVSWYLVLSDRPLYQSVWRISLFYAFWALYNVLGQGEKRELGHITMGLLSLTTYFEKRIPSIGATGLVMAHYALAAYYLVFVMSAEKVAREVKGTASPETIRWAYIFKTYLVSNIALYGTILYKLIKMNDTKAD